MSASHMPILLIQTYQLLIDRIHAPKNHSRKALASPIEIRWTLPVHPRAIRDPHDIRPAVHLSQSPAKEVFC